MGFYLEVANKRPPEGSQSGKFYLWCQIQYMYCLLPCIYVKLFQDIAATVKIFADWLSHSS